MWGAADIAPTLFVVLRIIPTHVGSSVSHNSAAGSCRDHPHACGEQEAGYVLAGLALGSSPRMWGAEFVGNSQQSYKRIIPTHVGSSLAFNLLQTALPDHPHACGEQEFSAYGRRPCDGSSPRMWGAVFYFFNTKQNHRIIPTHVGSRWAMATMAVGVADHPHACGEQLAVGLNGKHLYGSSPRMWGAVG